MGKTIVKEVFIVMLLVMVIVFTLGILLYDFIPTKQTLPDPIEYAADSSVTATLQEIADEVQADGFDETDGTQSLLKSYSIGEKDLRTYASRKAYESGKQDPFEEYVEPTTNTTDTNTTGNTTNPATVTNTTAGTQNPSRGTFFEKPNSK